LPNERPATRKSGGRSKDRKFFISLARAVGGALVFSMPMLMTMEMWWLGFYVNDLRLALFLVMSFPLLVGLDYFSGFKDTFRISGDVLDASVAVAVGFVSGALFLLLFGEISPGMSIDEVVGKVSLQAIPAAIGATLARAELGSTHENPEFEATDGTYAGDLFVMAIGALFLAFNLAPTEEIVVIAHRLSGLHVIALMALTLALMHAFVYAVEFRGQAAVPEGTRHASLFVRFTVGGYAVALLIALFVLWTFERTTGAPARDVIATAAVLGFPAGIGAAAARLLL
jgi:putative integral membrane protein (TIGR02587 family)